MVGAYESTALILVKEKPLNQTPQILRTKKNKYNTIEHFYS